MFKSFCFISFFNSVLLCICIFVFLPNHMTKALLLKSWHKFPNMRPFLPKYLGFFSIICSGKTCKYLHIFPAFCRRDIVKDSKGQRLQHHARQEIIGNSSPYRFKSTYSNYCLLAVSQFAKLVQPSVRYFQQEMLNTRWTKIDKEIPLQIAERKMLTLWKLFIQSTHRGWHQDFRTL